MAFIIAPEPMNNKGVTVSPKPRRIDEMRNDRNIKMNPAKEILRYGSARASTSGGVPISPSMA